METRNVADLVVKLEEAAQLQGRGRAYRRVCKLSNSQKQVISWKFNEWDYGKNNINLPCYARGLFILDDENNPVIVARGYDKFFNIDETSFTRWDAISKDTQGPYHVTLKANGCIIFVSGLEDGSLVVCSKHSTGPRDDVDRNHADAGETFLREQLSKANIDPKELALDLYQNNVTAVAEYCDDTFEEHILEYTNDKIGLYLHGINLNEPEFRTWDFEKVTEFGKKYGFKTIEHEEYHSADSLKEFLGKCSMNGTYKGQEVEGFVIRCKKNDGKTDFFFKFKFEEPYLMYRQWREVTKDYIASKSRVFRFRKHRFITNKYLDFVIPKLDADTKLCEDYVRGFGIIKLRNEFLKDYGMSGVEILNHEKVLELEQANQIDHDRVDENTKFLIIPIAVIGCGKTTTSMTINNIYPESWGHVQNDDITGKDNSQLMKKSLELLAKPGIKCVVVDRNNHQWRERKELFDWLEEYKEDYLPYDTNIKVIGISFTKKEDLDNVREITEQRVFARGDDHQSIKLSKYGEKKVLGIMSGFIKRFQPVNEDRMPDCLFDHIIYLSVNEKESSLKNSKTILSDLHQKYPILIPSIPSDEELEVAFEKSLNYKPSVVKVINDGRPSRKERSKGKNENGDSKIQKQKAIKPVYFLADINRPDNMISSLIKTLDSNKDIIDESGFNILKKFFSEKAYQKKLHVTLIHVAQGKKGGQDQQKLWQLYVNKFDSYLRPEKPLEPEVDQITTKCTTSIVLDKLYWDDNIVTVSAIINDLLDEYGRPMDSLKCCNVTPHITVGILKEGVKPVYSNELLKKMNDDNVSNEDGYSLELRNMQPIPATLCIHL
ncbi:tRNA ligase [Nakaseomyces bracarensis]|uniref:tRNA ligase n=1 Tax=Nakaseomyces bracarensis TaxID=273131 RepID=A0ABR4NZ63_9SACH